MRRSNGDNKGERPSFIKPLPMCAIPALEISTNFLEYDMQKNDTFSFAAVFGGVGGGRLRLLPLMNCLRR